ncbi:ABC transporter ATP-binding protein [Bacillus cytotoxicus]|uniref:ABC transporter ATP-binding protein n=1 Tax=Bacillus cereus group TaxID=86661 RepID=UPI001F564561|nr:MULTISPECIES: ABC transporter ATP-binding protein [Bacillus cereus group]EMA6341816.1 ABC transporter ATP-binding protein [Bacillus cytotoxicus]MDH2887014.1 ABC transporter ATP-binding protein [Bacillus cytotoxicus]
MSLIKLENIYKEYGAEENKVQALQNISIDINKGEMVAVMGSSGSGKSTLLNIIGGLDKKTSGNYYLNGKDISELNNRELASLRNNYFGFVVQHFALIEDYNVYQNIKVPLDYSKYSKKEKDEKINKILKQLGINSQIKKLPYQLSGGQNQRVSIARALINDPEVILADEPTGSLDKKTGQEVMNLLKNINEDGKTIIIVTHDDNVANMCERIIKIEDGTIKY